jgi:choice-of-anchor A domain-containing protein
MWKFTCAVLLLGLSAAVTLQDFSNDREGAPFAERFQQWLATAPMNCDQYEQQMVFLNDQLNSCSGRRCSSFSRQLAMVTGIYERDCTSTTPTASPSLAPSFQPCKCMDYGGVEANTITFADFGGTSDTEGKLYVGGSASLKGYSVGESLAHDCSQDALVVAGDLDFFSGRIYHQSATVGGNANVPVGITDGLASGCSVKSETPGFSFSGASSHYTSLSSSLCARADTGHFDVEYGHFQAMYTNAHTEVFSTSCSELSSATSIGFGGISGSASVILNIHDADCVFNTEVVAHNTSNVLFNFCEATSIDMRAASIQGSVLAPLATLSGNSGVIWGQIVVSSMTGAIQQNDVVCRVCVQ